MEENSLSEYILVIMKNLNFIIILYVSLIISYSLSGYIQENSAYEFLAEISVTPPAAWKIPVVCSILYISFLMLMFIKNIRGFKLVIKLCLEIVTSFFISYILGFSYTGIVLLIIADTMKFVPKQGWKFPFIVFICFFYFIADYDLMSLHYNLVSLETYIGYFKDGTGSVLMGIKNIVNSLNTFIFLIYMILLVRIHMNEKERIMHLNNQLNSANDELKYVNMQLSEYAKESEKMAETKERNRLAREIHDTLGHSLTGIITGIEACTTLMDVAPEATKEQLKAIAEVARQGITDVRRSVKALRPDALEKSDLSNALVTLISEMRSATSAEIEYSFETSLNCFNEDEVDIIYRIVQECITNSIRHGKAGKIYIYISREFNLLKILIKDNGTGCAEINKGFGLHHMEERLDMLHGSLNYNGNDGFIVEAKIPIRWGTEEKG